MIQWCNIPDTDGWIRIPSGLVIPPNTTLVSIDGRPLSRAMLNNLHHRLFANFNDKEFTTEIFQKKHGNHRNIGEFIGLDSLLLPLTQLSTEVSKNALAILNTKEDSEQSTRLTHEFIGRYQNAIDGKILPFREAGEFPEKNYADDHGVILLNTWLFWEEAVVDIIRSQKAQGLLGKYCEFMLGRIVNGIIQDINGSQADIIVKSPDGTRILIESKSARLSNKKKYFSEASGKWNSASRNGIFMKRNQIFQALQETLHSPNTIAYTALVDYDFIGGEDMTFTQFTKLHPKIFENIKEIEHLYEIEARLRDVVTIKNITLIPTWNLYDTWNRFIEKTRLVRQRKESDKKKDEPISDSAFAQYMEQSQNRMIRAYLDEMNIPLHTHTLKWLQNDPIQFESYGFKFVPEKEMTYGKK